MKQVWKFPVMPGNDIIEMPKGAKVLAFQHQDSIGPMIWALVDPDAELEPRRFIMVDTGQGLPDDVELTFIDTLQLLRGTQVLHLFEAVES